MKKFFSISLMLCMMFVFTSTIAMATPTVDNIVPALLSENADNTILLGTPTVENDIVTVPVAAKGIIEHVNTEGDPGYWVGFALIAPDDATKVKYAFSETQQSLGELNLYDLEIDITESGDKGVAFYADAYLENPKTWAKVQWMKDTIELGEPITYNMDLSGVEINISDIGPAILSTDTECELGEPIIEDNTITVPVIAEDLVEHRNAEGDYGYWAGFAVTAPVEATQVKYTFGDEVDKTIDLEENVDGQGGKGIVFYTDAYTSTPNKEATIQWVYGTKEGKPITYKMDLSGVELKFPEISKARLKSDEYIDTYEIESTVIANKVNVKITTTELVEHLNKNDEPGYWVGFALTAPEGATKVKYTFGGNPEEIELEENVDGKGSKGIAFYTDAYATTPKTTAKVQWKYSDKWGHEVTYNMNLTNVKFEHGDIVAAVLAENAGCDDLAIDNVTVAENGEVTVAIKGSGLVEHKNAEDTLGYWAGFALLAPDGATEVEYTFGGETKTIDLEENIDGQGSKGIAFYTDVCAETPATTAEVRWVYGSKYGYSVKYNMNFDGVKISIPDIIPAKLAESARCEIELGDLSIDNGIVTIPLKAQNLPEHKNAKGEYGYWVGFGLVAPAEATKVKYTFGDETKTIDLEENIDGEGSKGIAFYTDAYLETPKTEATVQWMKDAAIELGEPVAYKMDLTDVKLKLLDVSPAILSESAGCLATIETPTFASGIVTVPVKATNLMEHKNEANTSGYWIGMALVAPEGATKVKYAFANSETALETLTEKDLEMEVTIKHDKGIAFYANAKETSPKVWIKVQWVYGDKVGHVVKYKMDLTGVTLKKYTITFDANGHGTAPQSQEVLLNQLATQPANPTETGYTFGGWHKEATCLTKYNFATPVTADIILYAKWTAVQSSSGGGGGGGGGGSASDEVQTYKITVTEGKNGSISPNGTVTIEKGDNQKFKIKPDKGYEIEDVIVDGKSVGVVDSYTFKNVKKKHTIKATFQKIKEETKEEVKEEIKPEIKPEVKPIQTNKKYTDVKENAWYATPIQYVTRNNLMTGVGNDKFSPSNNGTRAMIVTILYNKEGKPTVNGKTTFTDVKSGVWYETPIAWAKANNVVDGYGNGTFGPDKLVTREQMAVILYNYAKAKGAITFGNVEVKFSDTKNISTWAYEAMRWCVSNKIINGKENNTLDPKGFATRAEIATMIMNFCEI